MALQHGVKRFQMERLIQYFGSAEGDSTIDMRSVGKGCGYDHGYVARQWICFEPCHCFIASNVGHEEIHENQIGTGGACLL